MRADPPADAGDVAPGAVRSTSIVGVSLVAWGIGSYAYYLIAGRMVGPATYGLVSAMIAVIAIIGWPSLSLQWSMARTFAAHGAADRPGVLAVYRHALVRATALAVVLAAIAITITLVVSAAGFGVPVWAVVATALSAIPMLPLAVVLGALQGRHRYGAYAAAFAATGVLRALLILPLLLLPVVGATPVVLATGIALAVGVLIAMWHTRGDLRIRAHVPAPIWRSVTRGMGATVVGLLGFASIFGLGVVVARLRLTPVDAGYFGAAGVLARAMIIAPQALTVVLLPRIASRRSRDVPTGALLGGAVLVTTAIGVIVSLACIVVGDQVMHLTFGASYASAGDLLPQYVLTSTLICALFLLVNHHVARGDHRFAWFLGGLALLHVVLLGLLGNGPNAIIAIDGVAAVLGLLGHEWIYRGTGDGLIAGSRMALSAARSGVGARGG